ncbi:hypothetical protein HOS55_gp030 [Pseudomonas phage PMBT3]|uniref:Uncharacterized protein n=1 Tax=Pseudomonas phage PMBT3 TaxID=2059856 RepID=A0A2I6PHV7_9CAUD|nr:hypothetical protein HOS55_gp030 [Pseudomonas phage PMBT3]AUM59632.1 hypothetical protein [Pseudomonas phage PMBT3]
MIVASHTPQGVITTQITLKDSCTLTVTTEGVSTASMPAFKVDTKEVALRGAPGASAEKAQISDDADNRLTLGSDQKLYVADTFIPDPLAYYLLERGNI